MGGNNTCSVFALDAMHCLLQAMGIAADASGEELVLEKDSSGRIKDLLFKIIR